MAPTMRTDERRRKNGNLAARKDNMRNLEETFEYDSQNRLKRVRLGPTLTGASVYDSYGRMTAKTANGQLIFYDAEFGTTAKPHAMDAATTVAENFPQATQTITYTGFDKVKKIKQGADSLCYTYGYDHQRILMEEHVGNRHRTKRYVGNCEYITKTNGNVTDTQWLTYLTGPTGVYAVVATENGRNKIHYILKDNLGSWTTITDEEGSVEQRLNYDAWGNLRDPNYWTGFFSGVPVFDRGFTGHEHLPAFGLINMNGRMYDPVMSSFLSVDQYVQSPENAQGFNRYAYCMNNPLKYIDPSGWRCIGGITGYTPNSADYGRDPYAYADSRGWEPRDLGIRELSTSDPVVTWMEENKLHGGGSGSGHVKPAGNAEVEMIRNTLPKEARPFVQLDKNGFINKFLLNLCIVESLNLDNLKTLVNSDLVVEVILDDRFVYMDSNGNFSEEKMNCYPYDPNYPEDLDATGSTIEGLSTGENGYLGQTLFPDLDGSRNSPNGNIIVIINKHLSSAGAAETYSHEANGHALLYILNGGDHFGAGHQPINDGFVEGNIRLSTMIINSKRETIINMKRP